jgi:hypothetical protein
MTFRLLVLTLTLGACRSTGYPELPRHLQGHLAARVYSALRPHPALHCSHHIITLGRGMQGATGCYFYSNDSSLFYFYFEESGDVLAWDHSWHVPDSTREQALRALILERDSRYGVGQICPPSFLVESFTFWRDSGYFLYVSSNSNAARLGLPYNIYEGDELGPTTCTDPHGVFVPFGTG